MPLFIVEPDTFQFLREELYQSWIPVGEVVWYIKNETLGSLRYCVVSFNLDEIFSIQEDNLIGPSKQNLVY
jgi:hypothetical protein